jgi:hypothetical protein
MLRGPLPVKARTHGCQHFRHIAHDIVLHFVRLDDHDAPVLCRQSGLDVLEAEPCQPFTVINQKTCICGFFNSRNMFFRCPFKPDLTMIISAVGYPSTLALFQIPNASTVAGLFCSI